MTKELFIEAIEAIRLQEEHDNNYIDLLSKVFPDAFEANLLYDNSFIKGGLLKLLSELMHDNGEWIEYFIYELDYGKKYKKGCATYEDGKNIDLSNAGALYEFLKNDI